MIVVVTIAKVTIAKLIFLVFCSDDNISNGKVNKRRTIYGKLVRNGTVIESYAGCDRSCNSHNLG